MRGNRKGLAANVMELAPRWLVLTLVFLLVGTNTSISLLTSPRWVNFLLVIGGLNHEHALIFAATSTLLQVFVPYRRYAPVLKFMTLTLPALRSNGAHREHSLEHRVVGCSSAG